MVFDDVWWCLLMLDVCLIHIFFFQTCLDSFPAWFPSHGISCRGTMWAQRPAGPLAKLAVTEVETKTTKYGLSFATL
jgi:hypothetical protein